MLAYVLEAATQLDDATSFLMAEHAIVLLASVVSIQATTNSKCNAMAETQCLQKRLTSALYRSKRLYTLNRARDSSRFKA